MGPHPASPTDRGPVLAHPGGGGAAFRRRPRRIPLHVVGRHRRLDRTSQDAGVHLCGAVGDARGSSVVTVAAMAWLDDEPVRGGYPDASLLGLSGLERMRAGLHGPKMPPPPIH